MFFKITVDHEGCWSQLLSKYHHTYGILLNQVIIGSNTIKGYLAFYVDEVGRLDYGWNNFFEELKGHESVWKLEHVETLSNGKTYLIELSSHLTDSMSELMNKYNCPYFSEIFYGGYETWYIYSWYESYESLINDVKNRTKIVNLEKLDQEDFSRRILPFYEDKYFNLLEDLYNRGYYLSNKKLKLRDVATSYSISKSNVSKKLRRAEINAISHYIGFRFDGNTTYEEKSMKWNRKKYKNNP